MNDLEHQVRTCLQEAAGQLRSNPDPVGAVRRHARRRFVRRRRTSALAVAAVALAGLTTGVVVIVNQSSQLPTPPSTASTSIVSLTPSNTRGVTNCGSTLYSATTPAGTQGLASCAGIVGLSPPPVVTISVGQVVTISAATARLALNLTVDPGDVLTQQGSTFRADQPGQVTVTIHDAQCLPTAQPTTCTLLIIRATP